MHYMHFSSKPNILERSTMISFDIEEEYKASKHSKSYQSYQCIKRFRWK